MGVYCCVPFCKSQSEKSNVSFHEFPSKKSLLLQWIKNISRMLKEEIEKEYRPDKIDNSIIRRFLIAREYNVKQAYLMLKKNLEWREKYHADTIIEDFQKTELFEKYVPFSYLGFSEDGFHAALWSIGSVDVKGYFKSTTLEDSHCHLIYIMEKNFHLVKEENAKKLGTKEERLLLIVDMAGMQLSHLTNKKATEYAIHLCTILEANYPEILKKAFVINTSTTFQIFYSVIKPFISMKSRQKIKVYGKDDWKEDLVKKIGPKILPAYLGGEKTDPDGNPMCYSTVCHGGPVPERLYLKNTTISEFKNQPGVQSFVIKLKSKFDLPLQITLGGSFIKWEFEVDNYDIGFGLFYKTSDTQEDEELLPLIPLQRSNLYQPHENGSLKCENPGIYICTWDNSYSFFRSKVIYYKVSVIDPDHD